MNGGSKCTAISRNGLDQEANGDSCSWMSQDTTCSIPNIPVDFWTLLIKLPSFLIGINYEKRVMNLIFQFCTVRMSLVFRLVLTMESPPARWFSLEYDADQRSFFEKFGLIVNDYYVVTSGFKRTVAEIESGTKKIILIGPSGVGKPTHCQLCGTITQIFCYSKPSIQLLFQPIVWIACKINFQVSIIL